MTEKEFMKALECCILGDCQGCLYGDTDQRHCRDDLMQNALDLINRQKEELTKNEKIIRAADDLIDCQKKEIDKLTSNVDELESEYTLYKISAEEQIEALIAGQETLQKYIAEKGAEIEDLKIENEHLAVFLVEVKSEAVKEFAERLKEILHNRCVELFDDDIDNLVKEMVGETE